MPFLFKRQYVFEGHGARQRARTTDCNESTGKRISQKLLRNIVKFMSIIDDVLKILPMEFLKKSSDEVEMRGSESKYDTRRLNSYPSKVLHGHGLHLPCWEFSEIVGSVWSPYFMQYSYILHAILNCCTLFRSFIQIGKFLPTLPH